MPVNLPNLPMQKLSEITLDTRTEATNVLKKSASAQTYFPKPTQWFTPHKSNRQELIQELDRELERVNSDKEMESEISRRSEKEIGEHQQRITDNSKCFSVANTHLEGLNDRMKETSRSLKLALTNSPLDIPDIIFDQVLSHGDFAAYSETEKLTSLLHTTRILTQEISGNSKELIYKCPDNQTKELNDNRSPHEEASNKELLAELDRRLIARQQELMMVKIERDVMRKEISVANNLVNKLASEAKEQEEMITDIKAWRTRAVTVTENINKDLTKMRRSWF